ncbi:Alpha/Beta hydrolase protein [Xylaria sp. FL0043]|nr:Alpha/Beta hydrolase protein [Xylaria sp. FL0043]
MRPKLHTILGCSRSDAFVVLLHPESGRRIPWVDIGNSGKPKKIEEIVVTRRSSRYSPPHRLPTKPTILHFFSFFLPIPWSCWQRSPEMLENPALIYEGPNTPWLDRQLTPLILLHDGGGTTFSYHCMYPIGRTLYGIQNAKLDEGGYWESGISGMASYYIELIEKALPEGGDILLGGWSLGGLLSLEVAWQLANRPAGSKRPKFKVLGMIFIDSVYTKRLYELRDMPERTAQPIVKSPQELKAMPLREKVDLNMTHARMMITHWEMPDWTGREAEIPPTILMRAKELVHEDRRALVDYSREFRLLGWDHYHDASWIKEVVELDGHHFNIFEDQYIKDITAKIAAAADALDHDAF